MQAMASVKPLFAGIIGGWEIIFILALLMVLFGARQLPQLLDGFRRGIGEFIKATRDLNEDLRSAYDLRASEERLQVDADKVRKDELSLWVAQGFDVGRIPVAPGTFGSLVGVLWFVLLLVPGSLWLFVVGTLAGLAASVKYCGDAERILGEEDPGSVVLDEIVAIPICFTPWVLLELWSHDAMPKPETFFTGHSVWISVSLYLLFRVFDIWKPWPVRQSQSLPGGWGVTADDVLASIYVAALSLLLVR